MRVDGIEYHPTDAVMWRYIAELFHDRKQMQRNARYRFPIGICLTLSDETGENYTRYERMERQLQNYLDYKGSWAYHPSRFYDEERCLAALWLAEDVDGVFRGEP